MGKITRETALHIAKLRNVGKTNEQIAEILRISRTAVTYWVKRLRDEGHEVKRFGRGGVKKIVL